MQKTEKMNIEFFSHLNFFLYLNFLGCIFMRTQAIYKLSHCYQEYENLHHLETLEVIHQLETSNLRQFILIHPNQLLKFLVHHTFKMASDMLDTTVRTCWNFLSIPSGNSGYLFRGVIKNSKQSGEKRQREKVHTAYSSKTNGLFF